MTTSEISGAGANPTPSDSLDDRHAGFADLTWADDPAALSIHEGLSDIHSGLERLGNGDFGTLADTQQAEVERLEDTSQGVIEELEELIEIALSRGDGATLSRTPRRGSAARLGLARLLYEIERDKKSGTLRVEDHGRVDTFHLLGGEFGYPTPGAGKESREAEIRSNALGRISDLVANRSATYEFSENTASRGIRTLGLDTVRLVLDGIRTNYSTGELEETLGDPQSWRVRPGAMWTIANLPLSAEEMSIARLLGAGWTAAELSAETRMEGRVVPLAAALCLFGLFEASPDEEIERRNSSVESGPAPADNN